MHITWFKNHRRIGIISFLGRVGRVPWTSSFLGPTTPYVSFWAPQPHLGWGTVYKSGCQVYPFSPTGPVGASLKSALWGPSHLPPGLPGLPVWCWCGRHHRRAGEVGPWAGGYPGMCYLLMGVMRTKVGRLRHENLESCVFSLCNHCS